jgi:hypothetical protein
VSKEEDWGNEIETEEDGYRAEALRRSNRPRKIPKINAAKNSQRIQNVIT